jgi:hypothetical protein
MSTESAAAHPALTPRSRPRTRRARPSRFVRNIVTLLALLHVYVGARLLPALPIALLGRVIGALALCASFVLIIAGARARRTQESGFAADLAWIGSLNGGFFSSLAVLTVMRDIFLGPAVLLASRGEAATLESASAIAVPLLAALGTLIGFIGARRRPRVVDVEVPLRGLPPALQGFTIAQISDVHIGPTIKRDFLRGIVEIVNSLDVDLVAITGDLVDGSVEQLATHVEPLSLLRSRHGSYFVTGNHEYYSGATAWIAELRRLGLHVLLNEHVVLNHGSAPLLLAGVTDYSAGQFDPAQRSDPQAALAGAPPCGRECCSRISLGRPLRRRMPASTCSCRATRMAVSSGPGICSYVCSSPSPRDWIASRAFGSTPAAAAATGARPRGWACPPRSPEYGW